MRIVSISENKKIEKRIAVTPDVAKKYIKLGLEVSLQENYGVHLGIKDKEFEDVGVKILKDEKELINNSDLVVQLGLFNDDKNLFLLELSSSPKTSSISNNGSFPVAFFKTAD